MIKKEKLLPSLVTGFSLAVFSIIPVIQITTCCLLAPLAGMLGMNMYYLQMKNREGFKLQNSDGFQMGILIGLISGFFESIFQSLLIFVSKDNPVYESIILLEKYLPDMQLPETIWNISKQIDERRFSLLLTVMIFINTTVVNSIFATIGTMFSISTIRKKNISDSSL